MEIFSSIKSGFSRALKSWKGVVLLLIISLILVALIAIPLKSAIRSSFGHSMITDTLSDGFNLEAFTDLGSTLKSIMSFFTSGLMFVTFVGFIVFVFLSGGLFNSIKKNADKFLTSEFFKAGAKNFWSFLVISMIVTVIIIILTTLFTGVSAIIRISSESLSEKEEFFLTAAAGGILILLLPIFLLVVDYARARKVSDDNISCFGAVGYGFGQTFRKFWSSYFTMLIILSVQILFSVLVYFILSRWKPVTTGGVLLLFIASQLLFYIRLMIKTWRYASITVLMESDHFSIF